MAQPQDIKVGKITVPAAKVAEYQKTLKEINSHRTLWNLALAFAFGATSLCAAGAMAFYGSTIVAAASLAPALLGAYLLGLVFVPMIPGYKKHAAARAVTGSRTMLDRLFT